MKIPEAYLLFVLFFLIILSSFFSCTYSSFNDLYTFFHFVLLTRFMAFLKLHILSVSTLLFFILLSFPYCCLSTFFFFFSLQRFSMKITRFLFSLFGTLFFFNMKWTTECINRMTIGKYFVFGFFLFFILFVVFCAIT